MFLLNTASHFAELMQVTIRNGSSTVLPDFA